MKEFTGCIFILLMWLGVTSCHEQEKKEQGEGAASKVLSVEGYKVVPKDFNTNVVVTADLLPNEQVELKAPMAGQVLKIYFNEGKKIKKGRPIIKIDDRGWKAQLGGLKAELDAAEKVYDRKKAMLKIEGSSQEEVELAFSNVQQLKAQINQLELNIDLANVSAPFSGWLGMRNFSIGAYLKEGDVITTLTELDRLKADFTLAQEHKESVVIGKTVQVLVDGDTLQAKIYAINPTVSAESRTINVRARLNQPSGKMIMPGTFAEVWISANFVENALLVPTQAIVPEINDQTVYLYKKGKAIRKTIQMGNRTSDLVRVIEGIHTGDTLITSGLLQVKDGMEVKLHSVKQ